LPADIREVTRWTRTARACPLPSSRNRRASSSRRRKRCGSSRSGTQVDGDVVADKALVVASGATVIVQAGKRKFARVTVR
jgi:hypothetical protein